MRGFIVGVLATFLAANLICWLSVDSILVRLEDARFWRLLFGLFILVQVLGVVGVIAGRIFGHQPGTGMGRPLLSLVMIWNMLLAVPAAVVYLIGAIVACCIDSYGQEVSESSIWHDRILFGVGFFPALALLGTLMALRQLRTFRVREMKLTIPNLPPALKGLSIVHLSDLHIGKLTRGSVLEEMLNATNDLDADLILITGDVINMSLEDLPTALELLRRMRSKYGLFLCEGNHDLIESQAGFEQTVRKSGIRFLLNESASVPIRNQRVQILGLRWGEAMNGTKGGATEAAGSVPAGALAELLAQREAGDFTILLAHHPEAFDAAAQAGIPLTLAGHTHGGQLMLAQGIGFGPWLYRYWSGLYKKGASQLVVSNGTGNWFPLRLGAPAEVIRIVLN